MNERIKQLRLELGMSQEEFGNRLGVGRGAITNIELNKVEPKPLFVSLICKTYGVRESWLRDGTGPMYTVMDERDELARIFEEIGASDDELVKAAIRVYCRLDEKEEAAIRKLTSDLVAELDEKKSPGE